MKNALLVLFAIVLACAPKEPPRRPESAASVAVVEQTSPSPASCIPSTTLASSTIELPPPAPSAVKPAPPERVESLREPASADSIARVLAMLAPHTSLLTDFLESMEDSLRAHAGTVCADSAYLRLEKPFAGLVLAAWRAANSPAFQAALYAPLAYGQHAPDTLASTVVRALAVAGIWTYQAEGDVYFAVDHGGLARRMWHYLTNPMRQYLRMKALEQTNPTGGDASIGIPHDSLSERLAATDRFLTENPNAAARDAVIEMRRWYLRPYFGGWDNTPVFDFRSKTLRADVRASFERYVAKYGSTSVGELVGEYLTLLKANDYRPRAPVVEFLLKKADSHVRPVAR